MIEIVDLQNVTIDGVTKDLVSAIADSPEISLGEIQTAITQWDAARQQELSGKVKRDLEQSHFAEISQLRSSLIQREEIIAELRSQLQSVVISDWPTLVKALDAAGFFNWALLAGAEAVASANPEDAGACAQYIKKMGVAADTGDRAEIIQNYIAISQFLLPTVEQLQAWQAVLDEIGIPKNLLYFIKD